jgi:hypothetical protein
MSSVALSIVPACKIFYTHSVIFILQVGGGLQGIGCVSVSGRRGHTNVGMTRLVEEIWNAPKRKWTGQEFSVRFFLFSSYTPLL